MSKISEAGRRGSAAGAALRYAITRAGTIELDRLRLSVERRHAIALRVERLACGTNVPARLLARWIETLEPYAPTDEQIVVVVEAWARSGVDPVGVLAALYRNSERLDDVGRPC